MKRPTHLLDGASVNGDDRSRASWRGQGLVEYGLILGLIAVVAIVALAFFGNELAAALSLIGQAIDSAR